VVCLLPLLLLPLLLPLPLLPLRPVVFVRAHSYTNLA
jgi:hypothetical protein